MNFSIYDYLGIFYMLFIFICSTYMLINLLNKDKVITKEYVASINGYYTRGVNGVLFEFKGTSFDRPFNLMNKIDDSEKSTKEFYKNYKLKLYLKEFNYDVYYIDKIELLR